MFLLSKILQSIDSEPTGAAVLARVIRLENLFASFAGKSIDELATQAHNTLAALPAATAAATGVAPIAAPIAILPPAGGSTPVAAPGGSTPVAPVAEHPALGRVLAKFAVGTIGELLDMLDQQPAPGQSQAQQPQQGS